MSTNLDEMEKQFHLILRYDLLTLSNFFKRLLLILLGIFNQMIVTTQKAIIKDSERSEGVVELLTRKGVYPYDYVSSIERFSETQLPPKSEFYSRSNDADISDADYQHALNVWNTFQCQTIRDYNDLYLKSDVLLLADVFESFRKICFRHYNLDPAHYYTSPGLAWDACLKTTGQELQLLHDYDMWMMFERGIRGGITQISRRYV